MAHLLFHVCERCAVLDKQTPKCVAEVMESKSTQPCVLKAGEKLVVHEIVGIDHCPSLRREHEIICNVGPPRHHRLKHPFVSQFQQSPSQLAREVYTSRFLTLRRGELALDEVALHQNVPVGVVLVNAELNVAPCDREQLAL